MKKHRKLENRNFYTLLIALLITLSASAQLKVGDNPTILDGSAILELESDSLGLLIPRLTDTERDNIDSPATGLLIFNNTVKELQYNFGTKASPQWLALVTGTPGSAPDKYVVSFTPNGTNDSLVIVMSDGTEYSSPASSGGDGDAWNVDGEDTTNAISRSGYVGIGVTNPARGLHVADDMQIRIEGTTPLIEFFETDAVLPNGRYRFAGAAMGDFRLQQNTSLTGDFSTIREIITVDPSGNVGIGTSIPTQKLDVAGEARIRSLPQADTTSDTIIVFTDINGNLHGITMSEFANVLIDNYKFCQCPEIKSSGTLGGDGGACTPITVNGSYAVGTNLDNTNTIDIEVSVDTAGSYTITTDTINGYSFSASGTFAGTGTQSLSLVGTGTPSATGTNVFTVSYGNSSCTFSITPTVHGLCVLASSTTVVDVTGATGRVWMDRNLGANSVATSATDHDAYGCLYQWGRDSDGHELVQWTNHSSGTIVNGVTSTNSATDDPGHSDFITESSSPHDWRSPGNNLLWQGSGGINNPCPSGYSIPTEAEWMAEYAVFPTQNVTGAYNSPLKLTEIGYRSRHNGLVASAGDDGYYWSSTVTGTSAKMISINHSFITTYTDYRAWGFAVRCIKD